MYQILFLIRDSFNLNHLSVYELDFTGQWAVLRHTVGDVDHRTLPLGYKLPVDSHSATGWCLVHQKPHLVLHLEPHTTSRSDAAMHPSFYELAVPLTSRNAIIGALTLQSAHTNTFTEADVRAIREIADDLAGVIIKAKSWSLDDKNDRQMPVDSVSAILKPQIGHLLDDSPIVVFTCGPETPYAFTFVSDNAKTMLGFDPTTATESNSTFSMRIHPADWSIPQKALDHLLDLGHSHSEYRLQNAEGEYRWISDRRQMIYDSNHQPREIVGCWIDITDSRISGEAAKRLNRELALLYRASRALAASLDLDEVLTSVTQEMQHLLNVTGCSVWLKDEIDGTLIRSYSSGTETASVSSPGLSQDPGLVNWVLLTGQNALVHDLNHDPRHVEYPADTSQRLPRSGLYVPLRSSKGTIGVLEVVDAAPNRFVNGDLDLLESLSAMATISIENAHLYEQARQDTKTKSILLDEINHRVKNNLTAIMGILSLEMKREFNDPQDFHETLNDILNRIQSITTVHSLLSEVHWNPLPIARLVEEIIHVALSASPLRKHIKVQIRSETIPPDGPTPLVSPQQATGLAIIINEFTTNTIKHAFSKQQSGHISVRIHSEITQSSIQTRLEFRDDGPGWPQDILGGTRSGIGMRLIRLTIASPLRGQLDIFNDSGAVAVIQFNLLPLESHQPMGCTGATPE